MMQIREQDRVLGQIVDDLLHETYPASCNLVVPPGFGEIGLVRDLERRMNERQPDCGALVAVIEPDTLRDVRDYVTTLHAQWSKYYRLPGLQQAPSDHWALDTLVGWLPDDRPAIQLISRFHQLVNSLGAWVLGRLRTFEQSGRIRTLTVTPLPYQELKLRQEDRTGQILTVSDYGNNPQHTCHVVKPPPIDSIRMYCGSLGIGTHLGGYPEPFEAVVSKWIRMNRPGLEPQVRKDLWAAAVHSLARFVEWLDFKGTRSYCEQVAHLHQGIDTDQALWQLRHHPWGEIILDRDELRSEAVGAWACETLLQDAIAEGRTRASIHAVADRAQLMYSMRQFAGVSRILEATSSSPSDDRIEFLRLHSAIMADLYQSAGDAMGADANWAGVAEGTDRAMNCLKQRGAAIHESALLVERYERLSDVARVIKTVSRRGEPSIRLVDVLAGLYGTEDLDPRVAALLIISQRESSRSVPGNTSACLIALPLPEQIFRVWGFWALGLNYYHAPEFDESVHSDAALAWSKRAKGEMRRPIPEEPFPSFPTFAYYSLAVVRTKADGKALVVPEPDYKSLDRALTGFEFRNDTAHAVTLTRKKTREQFFSLIDRWLDCLIAHCPIQTTRAELTTIIDPLPLIDQHHALVWV
jgi:hypothetical protein